MNVRRLSVPLLTTLLVACGSDDTAPGDAGDLTDTDTGAGDTSSDVGGSDAAPDTDVDATPDTATDATDATDASPDDGDATDPDTEIPELPDQELPDQEVSDGDTSEVGDTPDTASCGDAIVDPDERCDDGNTAAYDACSADCQTAACVVHVVDGPYLGIQQALDDETCSHILVLDPGVPTGAYTTLRSVLVYGVPGAGTTLDYASVGPTGFVVAPGTSFELAHLHVVNARADVDGAAVRLGEWPDGVVPDAAVTELYFRNVRFAGNRSGGSPEVLGGAVGLDATTDAIVATFDACVLEANEARADLPSTKGGVSHEARGGAVGMRSTTGALTLNLWGTTFDQNEALVVPSPSTSGYGYGGAVAVMTGAGNVSINALDARWTNNAASADLGAQGGALWVVADQPSQVGISVERAACTGNAATGLNASGGCARLAVNGGTTSIAFSQSTFATNTVEGALAQGGAVSVVGAATAGALEMIATFWGSTFSDNVLRGANSEGAAIWLRTVGSLGSSVQATLERSTLVGNSIVVPAEGVRALGAAGFINSASAVNAIAFDLVHVTIRSNTIVPPDSPGAIELGGELFALETSEDTGIQLSTSGSILPTGASAIGWCSQSGPGASFVSEGNNILTLAGGCEWPTAPSDLLDVDPLLRPLANNGGLTQTRLPRDASPAIDAIAGCGAGYDQRGFGAPAGAGCDIGATELQDGERGM